MRSTMRFINICSAILFVSICAFSQNHFLTDANYRKKVETNFQRQQALAQNRSEQLFGVFKQQLTVEEEEALKFLYAYMPLNDLADYDGGFYLKMVRASLEARETFPWGKKIPEGIFRHFVLPYRVNNENLDTSRVFFLHELKDRIINLSMKQAALEVNHWCHEKVTYKGTDGRTISPFGAMNTAYGRCGEETTFGVSVLRAVGIPARQCYTPRWAHCDDNHAWIEVWVDGTWYYMGGCEPEPDFNMAWFTEPARRAMLVNTRVFGDYEGPEEAISKTESYTLINVLPEYAVTKKLFAQVVDDRNRPVADASVEFKLYNYAEFYTLAKKTTDEKGFCSFTTGMGDLLVWAYRKDRFGYEKVSVGNVDTAIIVLDREPGKEYTENLDCIPPMEKPPYHQSEAGKEGNAIRLKHEDDLRNAFASKFMDSAKAYQLAVQVGVNPDSSYGLIKESRGNWTEISAFLQQTPVEMKASAVDLLNALAQKDLHDVHADVLTDHLLSSYRYATDYPGEKKNVFVEDILSPRIANELLIPYKDYLCKQFGEEFIGNSKKDVKTLIEWIQQNIKIDPLENYYHVPITPSGVYELRIADDQSRNIFFVAACRSFGIPARLNPATGIPEYYRVNDWVQVSFDESSHESFDKGYVILQPQGDSLRFTPEYYSHYTLGKFQDGVYKSLDFESNPDEAKVGEKIALNEGNYVLTTGNRLPSGEVLCRTQYFKLEKNDTKTIPFIIRNTESDPIVYGKFDLQDGVRLVRDSRTHTLENLSNSKGLVIVWIDPDKEPTKHVMADLQDMREWFEKWGGGMLFITDKDAGGNYSSLNIFSRMPQQSLFCYEDSSVLMNSLKSTLKNPAQLSYPVVAVLNPGGEVNYLSEGYRIGLGEQVANVLAQIQARCGKK